MSCAVLPWRGEAARRPSSEKRKPTWHIAGVTPKAFTEACYHLVSTWPWPNERRRVPL